MDRADESELTGPPTHILIHVFVACCTRDSYGSTRVLVLIRTLDDVDQLVLVLESQISMV